MGTIIARERKDGTTAFLAQVIIYQDGKIAHREAKTFDRRPAAANWIKRKEKELKDDPASIGKNKVSRKTVGDAIDLYIEKSKTQMGRTKAQVLASIKQYDIAGLECSEADSKAIVAFAEELSGARKPQTVANYLSHLAAVFAIARPAWGLPLDQQAMRDAQTVMKRLGLTDKSEKRDRRPTLDELDRLLSHFEDARSKRPQINPMAQISAFALFSTRRQDEIVRITWADFEESANRVLIRDMKHPGAKVGNDVWCDLPEEAIRIIKSMPRTKARIFPFSTDAISAAFTRACKFLEIEGLHFHDLRHEGISRLFEIGGTIPHVAAVSGHRSWQSLQRYTHLRQTGDKYAGWAWLDRLAPRQDAEAVSAD